MLKGTVALDTQIEYQGKKADTPSTFRFGGTLHLDENHDFQVQFDTAKEMLVGTYQSAEGSKVSLGELVGSRFGIPIPDTLTLQLHDALLVYQKSPASKAFLMSHLGLGLDLTQLPLLGRLFPTEQAATIQYQLSVATGAFSVQELATIRPLAPGIEVEAETLAAGLGVAVQMPFADTQVELPLAVNTDADESGTAGPLRLQAEHPAANDPAVRWYSLQKRIGPLHFNRIGVKYQDGALTFLLDAGLQATGLDIELEGLAVSTPLTEFKPSYSLSGLALDFKRSIVEIGGALQRVSAQNDTEEYDGMALIKVGRFSVGALGSYTEQDGHPSLFIYGATHAPLGGPPFFFVTGLSAGFGYNRSLTVPKVADVLQFPLVQEAMGSTNDTPGGEAMVQALAGIKPYLSPAEGEYWLAAGLSFTTFKLIDATVLLVASFGKAFELDVLGVATLALPPLSPKPFAEVQMALKGAFKPEEGFLGLSGQLTPASHIFAKAAKLTGGFAFHNWFAGPHADDFVTTIGGYHPHFKKPTHYPAVPRVGLHWQVDPHTLIKGESYFALCPQGIMAGGALELSYHREALQAHFLLGADFLMAWQPFHYEGTFQAHLSVDYTFHFWGTHHLTLDLGTDLDIWGPEFGGEATLDLMVAKVTVGFGAEKPQLTKPILWPEFQASFLPDHPNPVAVTHTAPAETGEGPHLGTFHPHELSFQVETPVPIKTLMGEELASDRLGIVPMGLASDAFSSTLTVQVSRTDVTQPEPMSIVLNPVYKRVPGALWNDGEAPGLQDKGLLEAAMGTAFTVKGPADHGLTRNADDLNVITTTVTPRDKTLWERPLASLQEANPRRPHTYEGITQKGTRMLSALGLGHLPIDLTYDATPEVETLMM